VTRFGRFARELVERFLGRYHEGPDVPPRYAEEVRLFRALSRNEPTEEEWEAFAVRLTERAYQDGFVRGLHWLERGWPGPEMTPEQVLEEQAAQEKLLDDPKWRGALEDPMNARRVKDFHDSIARAAAAGIDVHIPPGRRER
jgi:hypothetical protein